MHNIRPAKITSPVVSLNGGHLKAIPALLFLGVVGIGLSVALSMGSKELFLRQFLHTYLVGFCFVLSISVGCLFFVTIMHLTRAGWSVTLRRIAELYAMCLLPLFILFLPILILVLSGNNDLYSWNQNGWSVTMDGEVPAADGPADADISPIESLKKSFLNSGFFAVRIVAYFAIWGFIAFTFLRGSKRQDETGDKKITARLQALAAPFLILFAATVVFSSFDIEMSLSPLWFSTMFPVYFFAGAFLSSLCTILLTGMFLQRSGRVTDEITTDHYHDLGKLMQGFVIFWGYIAFSQFLLIWYANIPEETFWYRLRFNDNGWHYASLALLIGHLFVPFFLLMGRGLRRNRKILAGVAIFILCLHWLDHYWLIMPQMFPNYELSTNPFPLAGMGIVRDVACAIGVIGIYLAIFCLVARNTPLVPLKDPRLGEALNHEVH